MNTAGNGKFDQIVQDLRFGIRVLSKAKLFTTVAVLTLALGIGANTTMFSVVNSVLLRPLAGYETDRLVRITDNDPRYRAGFIPPDLYLELLKRSRSLEDISGQQFCPFNLIGVGEAEQITAVCTSANWFAMQHARAFLGRTFAPDEDRRGRSRVAVLSYAFWKEKFDGNRKTVGHVLSLNGAPWTVIGVMAPDFKPLGISDARMFTPNVIPDNPAGLIVIARLKSPIHLNEARAELKNIGDRLAQAEPGRWKGTHLSLTPALEHLTGAQRPLLLLLMGAVCFVLLIACVNVANLLLARSKTRRHEMNIRMALGASRARIVRFLLAEVLLICSIASVAAVGVAYLGLFILRPQLAYLPRAAEIAIDGRVFAWALSLGWVATLLAGIVPALRSAEPRDVAGMKSRATLKWQTSLLTIEVALALVLLVGAGLLVRTFANLRSAPLGYDPSNTLTSFLAMPEGSSRSSAESIYTRIRERLSAVPGVRSAATATSLPTGGVDMSIEVEPEGQVARTRAATATLNIVSEQYFRTMGINLRAGRAFTKEDRSGSAPVAIVSASIARKYFDGEAVGRRLHVAAVNFALTDAKEVWAEVVGVVDSVAVTSAGQTTAEHIYLPEAQSPVRFTYILLRTNRDPTSFVSALRRAVRAESPLTPLDEVRSMDRRAAFLTAAPRRAMWLLGVFAGLAGTLAAVGIYAVCACLAAQRRRETAIRAALGASALSLTRTLLGKPLRSIAAGIFLGLASAMGLTRFLAALLFGVQNVDPVTYASAAGVLFIIALLAMIRPIRRVIRMDLAGVLKQD